MKNDFSAALCGVTEPDIPSQLPNPLLDAVAYRASSDHFA